MSHIIDAASAVAEIPAISKLRPQKLNGTIWSVSRGISTLILMLGGNVLVAACVAMSFSFVVRHVFHNSTEWQDEISVFLTVGVTYFLAAAKGKKDD